MTHFKKLLIFILYVLSISSASVLLALPQNSSKDLMIIFTHDLHSYFLPYRILMPDGEALQQGSYAKLATLIQEQRKIHKDKTLLIDAGDFAMGTLFHTSFMTEASELRLMGKMGYDVITFGNHDFDFHASGLAKMLDSAFAKGERLPEIVASNVVFSKNDPRDAALKKAFDEYPVKEYTIIERNGICIGLFGILGKDAVHDAPYAKPVTFSDQIAAARRMVDVLKNREKADLVICLSHSGTFADKRKSEDEILAREVPQIDIIISGHTHTVLSKPIIIGNTIIVSSGSYGRYLGLLGIRHERKGGLNLISYELKSVSAEIPDNPAIASAIAEFKKIVNKKFLAPHSLSYDQVIAETGFDMETLSSAYQNPRETGLGNLITDSYRAAVKKAEGAAYEHVHLALQPLGAIRGSFQKGKITVADIFQVLSLGIGPDGVPGYPLVAFYISGKELKDTLEVHTTIAPLEKNDAYLQISGVKFLYNPKRIWFDRVTSVKVEDEVGNFQTLKPDGLYRICGNLYTAEMINYVSSASRGLIKVQPKDRTGRALPSLASAIVYTKNASELKEWLALTDYIRSFKDQHGRSIIPHKYSGPEGRYFAQPSLNPIKLFGCGNMITNAVLLTGFILLCVVAFVGYIVVGKARRRK